MDLAQARQLIEGCDPTEYHRYDRLSELLAAHAAAYPELCTVEVIGHSPEGRAVWAAALTNFATGPAAEKPGYLVEANTHAGEVTGSSAALFLIHHALTEYGRDPVATAALDTRVLYVVPRLTVDGTELYLTSPHTLRSSQRPYPDADERDGLVPEDVDGDGRILLMRLTDPAGEWKAAPDDPRLLVRRRPEDREGPFYRIHKEGRVRGEAARAIRPGGPRWGLDFNRNYPAFWNPEAKQPGAGRYPLSEPETRALAEFFLARPNITGYLALHTYGGVLLRPPSNGGDDKMNAADLRTYRALGDLCRRLTGYPCRSSHEAFTFDPGQPLTKGSKDWAYEQHGVIGFTMELWDLDGRAGARGYGQVGAKGLLALGDDERAADERKRLEWNDRELDGQGFIPWRSFDHPQLGPVEIGGWEPKFVRQNAPPHLLPEECRRARDFALAQALASPRLEAGRVEVTDLGGGCYRLAAEVKNTGYLSTSVTQAAQELKAARPVVAEITLPDGGCLVAGQARQELGHLSGFGEGAGADAFGGQGGSREAWAEWVVAAPAGSQLVVEFRCPRAGTVRKAVGLPPG